MQLVSRYYDCVNTAAVMGEIKHHSKVVLKCIMPQAWIYMP